jgi:PAS domain S-box-containing protein
MTPVRMASPTAPIKLSPVSAAPASAPAPAAPTASLGAMAAGAGSRPGSPAFGFRPKDGASPVPGPVSVGPKQAVPLAAAAAAPAAAPAAAAAAPAPDRSGVVERDVDGVVRPKTDQRALYYQLMNGLYDAVLILDDQGHIVDCNSRVTAMLGYSREDTWDIPIEKIITGMSSQMFEHLKRNLAENHHILIDARCFRQDGTSFAGEVGVSTLSLTRGSNIVFAIRNVDRRKSAMDEMRKGQSALEVALAPAFVCDLDGFFLIVNQAMLDAFGIPDEAQAKNVRFIDLLPDAARFFLRASCGEKLRESLRIPTPNGVPVKIELALKPVQSGQTVTAVAGSILQA